MPFIPANEGEFKYGLPGIFRAASVIFFAYVGFEAVSTAAAEAKNPQRDMPIGILGSLVVCTVIYMAVAAVLTGVVPFRELGNAAPIALAVDRMDQAWFAILIKVGAVAGLTSVMLILTYGQSRVFYAMARDGLLPRAFATLHDKFRTPWIGTIILGVDHRHPGRPAADPDPRRPGQPGHGDGLRHRLAERHVPAHHPAGPDAAVLGPARRRPGHPADHDPDRAPGGARGLRLRLLLPEDHLGGQRGHRRRRRRRPLAGA